MIRTVSNFVTEVNVLLSVNDNFLLAVYSDDFRGTLRLTRVVNQPPGSNNLA